MGTPIAQLRDDFTDNSAGSAWIPATAGSATVAETGGQFRATLPSSTAGTHSARYTSRRTYDITGDGTYINIDTMVATGVAATAFFQLYLDGNNRLIWTQTSGTLKAQKTVAGVTTDVYSVAWSAATYKYLRIREAGGSILFDSSTNGTSWTNRGGAVTNPFAMTDLYVDFGASCGNIASPGSFRIEDVNLVLPALTTNWRWQQIVWPLTERFKVVTLAIDTAGSAQGYVVTADTVDASDNPSGTIQYWSGPADGGRELTLCATQAQAQAMAVDIPLDGRFDLPTITEARCIRVYDRSIDGAAYTLREVYPRRLVQSDDIEAESIKAINIAAATITADKLFVTQLSAITANIGGLVIDTTGYLWQGTGTAAVPTTGLKIFNSGGIGKLSTYNAGVEQVTLDTDGALKAGAGAVVLDASGLSLAEGTGTPNQIKWYFGATLLSDIKHSRDTGTLDNTLFLTAESLTGYDSTVSIASFSPSGRNSGILLKPTTSGAGTPPSLALDHASGVATCTIANADVTISLGLNVGSATGAGTGVVKTSGTITGGTSVTAATFVNAGTSITATTGPINNGGVYQVGGTQIATSRRTGWAAPTATLSRTAVATGDTLAQTISHLAALITDLTTHGLIGA